VHTRISVSHDSPRDKRAMLLDAAARAFNERGVRGATLSDIGAAVGIATNSVTHYYRRKEELASACLRLAIDAIRVLAQEAAREADPDARVRRFFALQAGLLADVAAGRRSQLVDFNDLRALSEPYAADVHAAYNDLFRAVRALLAGAGGGLARDALHARTHLLLSVANSARTWLRDEDPEEHARASGRIADVLLHGLAGRGARWQDTGVEHDWRLAASAASGPADAFLRAATRLVNEQGYRGASVERISAQLKVTKGSFYHHNETKLDLIAACFERSFEVEREALRRAQAADAPGFERICAVARALAAYQLSDDGPLLRITAISALPDPAARRHVRQAMHRLTGRLTGMVVDGMVDGSIRPLDPAMAARILDAGINGVASVHRWAARPTPASVAGLCVRPIVAGLLCEAASVPAQARARPRTTRALR
jgi:AcrR family transcriptional regulator